MKIRVEISEGTKAKFSAIVQYILARLQEASTWRGIALAVGLIGAKMEPDKMELFVMGGIAVSAIIGILIPDKRERL